MSSRCGIVLAGGASRRMGRDKAAIEIDGETLVARTARVVAAICDHVVVVGAPGRALPPLPEGVVSAFDVRAFEGPLAGIGAGLSACPVETTSHALVVAVDMPGLRADALRALHALGAPDRAVAITRDGRIEPVPAWLPVRRARRALASPRSERSLKALLRDLDVRGVTAAELFASAPELGPDEEMEWMRDADDEEALAEWQRGRARE